jgi:hypothetical protein
MKLAITLLTLVLATSVFAGTKNSSKEAKQIILDVQIYRSAGEISALLMGKIQELRSQDSSLSLARAKSILLEQATEEAVKNI